MKKLIFLALCLIAPSAWAACDFREDTASQIFQIGPFVDPSTGDAEIALTITNTDVRISKEGGNMVAKNSGSCTHDEIGKYSCTFDATDTNTAGNFQIDIDETGALSVFHSCQVLGTEEYDRKYGVVSNLNALDVGLNEGPTTVATLATGIDFTIADGPTNDDALNTNVMCAVGGTEKGCAFVNDYTGGTKRTQLKAAVPFTLAVGDTVRFYTVPNPIVITADINSTGVTLQASAISASTFTAGAIDATAIATDAIGALEIATDAIGALEIATDAIGSAEIAPSAIGASELATDAIDSTKIAANAIGASEIAADAIGASEIATDAIGAAEIATAAIGAAEIDANAIGASEIAANAIGSSELATDAIGAAQLGADAVDEIWDEILETAGLTYTGRCIMAAMLAYYGGEASTVAGVTTYTDPGGGTTRLVGTVSGSVRNALTITCP